jgi:hypothetical protein
MLVAYGLEIASIDLNFYKIFIGRGVILTAG